jgi:hypothetical protein
MSLDLRDQMALQFASALARDDEDPTLVAERAYELAEAMLARRRELEIVHHEAELDAELDARSRGLAPVGEDPRGYEPAPRDWMIEPSWTQIPLFEPEGLLGEPPPPPSERDFGEPDQPTDYDPRWDAKPQWSPVRASPGLASTRPSPAGAGQSIKKASG